MRRLFLGFIICSSFFFSCKKKSTLVYDTRFDEVRQKVIDLVTKGKVASMSIAVAKNGKIIWEEAFGWSDLENKVRATPHTKYRSASIAKTITATGIMTLVEKGQVDLDKPIIGKC